MGWLREGYWGIGKVGGGRMVESGDRRGFRVWCCGCNTVKGWGRSGWNRQE